MTGQGTASDDEAVLEFLRVMRRLRAECPWKAAQTHRSLARYLLEETHETLEALDTGDADTCARSSATCSSRSSCTPRSPRRPATSRPPTSRATSPRRCTAATRTSSGTRPVPTSTRQRERAVGGPQGRREAAGIGDGRPGPRAAGAVVRRQGARPARPRRHARYARGSTTVHGILISAIGCSRWSSRRVPRGPIPSRRCATRSAGCSDRSQAVRSGRSTRATTADEAVSSRCVRQPPSRLHSAQLPLQGQVDAHERVHFGAVHLDHRPRVTQGRRQRRSQGERGASRGGGLAADGRSHDPVAKLDHGRRLVQEHHRGHLHVSGTSTGWPSAVTRTSSSCGSRFAPSSAGGGVIDSSDDGLAGAGPLRDLQPAGLGNAHADEDARSGQAGHPSAVTRVVRRRSGCPVGVRHEVAQISDGADDGVPGHASEEHHRGGDDQPPGRAPTRQGR